MMIHGLGPMTRSKLNNRPGSPPADDADKVPEAGNASVRSHTEPAARDICEPPGNPGDFNDDKANATLSACIIVTQVLIGYHRPVIPHSYMGGGKGDAVFYSNVSDFKRLENNFMLRQHGITPCDKRVEMGRKIQCLCNVGHFLGTDKKMGAFLKDKLPK
jgi:hypothetical protein